MSGKLSSGAAVLIVLAAALLGGVIGFFIPRGGTDTSAEGRVDYACSIAIPLHDERPTGDDWSDLSPEDSAVTDVFAISSLLGGMTPIIDESSPVGEAARGLLNGMQRLDTEVVADSLQEVVDYCETR